MADEGEFLGTTREVSLVEVLDRALGAGVVLTGDVTLALADVDLVRIDLRLLISSVGTLRNQSRLAEVPERASTAAPESVP